MGPSESMSKSKKNTIDPEKIIELYGADAVRFFILSDSPPEKDVQWSDSGITAAFKFIQKFWLLHDKVINFLDNNKVSNQDDVNLNVFTNNLIFKINNNLEKFSYNKIIANFHETYNFLSKNCINNVSKNFKENYAKILKLLFPVLPHLASECLFQLNENEKLVWPSIDNQYLKPEKIKIVIQINGKKRSLMETEESLTEQEIIEKVKTQSDLVNYLNNKDIFKVIYVKNKILNLIVK